MQFLETGARCDMRSCICAHAFVWSQRVFLAGQVNTNNRLRVETMVFAEINRQFNGKNLGITPVVVHFQ
jgi:hypothetical protein